MAAMMIAQRSSGAPTHSNDQRQQIEKRKGGQWPPFLLQMIEFKLLS